MFRFLISNLIPCENELAQIFTLQQVNRVYFHFCLPLKYQIRSELGKSGVQDGVHRLTIKVKIFKSFSKQNALLPNQLMQLALGKLLHMIDVEI